MRLNFMQGKASAVPNTTGEDLGASWLGGRDDRNASLLGGCIRQIVNMDKLSFRTLGTA